MIIALFIYLDTCTIRFTMEIFNAWRNEKHVRNQLYKKRNKRGMAFFIIIEIELFL